MTVKTTVTVAESRKATLADIRKFAAATHDWPEDVEVDLDQVRRGTDATGGVGFRIAAEHEHDPDAVEYPESSSPLPEGGQWTTPKLPLKIHPVPYYPSGARGPGFIGDVPPWPGMPGQVWCGSDTATASTVVRDDPRENVPMREH